MSEYNAFISDLLENDEELKKELDLLELKYKIIDELVNFRKSNNITQSQFADLIGVKQQAISRFEKGEVDARISFVSKIILGMKKKLFFTDTDFVKVNTTLLINNRKASKRKIEYINEETIKFFDLTA